MFVQSNFILYHEMNNVNNFFPQNVKKFMQVCSGKCSKVEHDFGEKQEGKNGGINRGGGRL